MAFVTIHRSGEGGEALKVDSWYNGLAYSIQFGESGSPMRTEYFQGDDASEIRAVVDSMEEANPDMLCRDIWLAALDPYL